MIAASAMPAACSRASRSAPTPCGTAIMQSAGSLRVEAEIQHGRLHLSSVDQAMAGRFAIPLHRAAGDSLGQTFEHAGQQRQVVPDDFHVDPARGGHGGQVPDQAKAGHVGAGVDAALDHQLRGRPVELGHRAGGRFQSAGRRRPIWAAKAMMPVPSGLVRTRQSPGRAPALVTIRSGCTSPVTAKPALISRVVDAVSADDGHARLGHLVDAAAKNLVQGVVGQRHGGESPRSKGP